MRPSLHQVDGFRPAVAAQPLSKEARRHRLYALLAAIDLFALFFAFSAAGLLRHATPEAVGGAQFAAMVIPIYLLISFNSKAYGFPVLQNWQTGIRKALFSLLFAVSAVLFVAFYAQASMAFSRLILASGTGLAVIFLIGGRYLFDRLVRATMHGTLRDEIVILDGVARVEAGRALVVDAAAEGLRPDPRDPLMLDRLGRLIQGADLVLVACAAERRAAWATLLKGIDVHCYISTPEVDESGAFRFEQLHGRWAMQVSAGPLDPRARLVKRLVDLAITIPVVTLLSPLLVLIAIAIKLDSPGSVIFRQPRLGQGNRLFSVYKFRSMRAESSDSAGDRSTGRDDDRITRVGRFLRKTSLDELPQLFNVLQSTMSLVGPRPHALGSTAGEQLFWDVDQRYWHRHALKPGITGLAQVRGLRGATHERSDLVKRLQADLEYLGNWSVWRDLAILAATARVLIHRNAF